MNRTTHALIILMIISYVAPSHAMGNNRPYFYVGLAYALLIPYELIKTGFGECFKQELDHQAQEADRIAQEEAQLALEQQPEYNIEQAQQLIADVQAYDLLTNFMIGKQYKYTIEQLAATYFDRYPLVYAGRSMLQAECKLSTAAALFQKALNNAHGKQELIRKCKDGLKLVNQLISAAQGFSREIRLHPKYNAQVEQEAKARTAQQIAQAKEREARAAEDMAAAAQVKAYAEERIARATEEMARKTK